MQHNSKPFGEDTVGTSKFYMIRCLIVMAHEDGFMDQSEEAYIMDFINRLPFSEEQVQTLKSDLKTRQPIDDLLPYIKEPKLRGQLVYFAQLMAYADDILHPNEELLLEKLRNYAHDGVDQEALNADIRQATQKGLHIHKTAIQNDKPEKRLPWIIDQALISLGLKA